MSTKPLVTVIVPARNEAADIGECLAAVAKQTYPLELIEVVVVDGVSMDATREIASAALASSPFRRIPVVTNENQTTPSSLNAGLRDATGDVVCRVDARSVIPPEYVETCVDLLENPNIAVAGGSQVPSARDGATLVERGIVRALRNPYTTGMARYRRNVTSGATDTVYLGAFRRADLMAEGGWDERFLTNQDYELNRRMARRGLVWFEADLRVSYRPRGSLGRLAHQYRRFGRWKAAGWLEGGVRIAPRHMVLVALPALAASVGLRLLTRRPVATVTTAVVTVALCDGSVRDAASVAERAASLAATAVVAGSWWGGVVEQVLRFLCGQRLLSISGIPPAQRQRC